MLGNRVCLGLSAAVLALALASCAPADASSAGPLRIGHNTNAAVLPVRVANDQNLFGKECSEVEFTVVENLSPMAPAVGKSFDIIELMPTDMIQAASRGIKLVGLAATTIDTPENPTMAVVASRASRVTKPKDLEGKTLGVPSPTGTLHYATLYWLQKEGVDIDSIRVVTVAPPALADQLAAGRVDAVESMSPFREVILKQSGTVDLGDPFLKVSPKGLGGLLWGAERQWAKDNPSKVQCFLDGVAKAETFIKENEAQARKSLGQYTGLPADVVAKTKLPTYSSEFRPQDLEKWREIMRSVADFDGDFNLDAMLLDAR
jgi:NitT/TauT family transport system substrate-binding protein